MAQNLMGTASSSVSMVHHRTRTDSHPVPMCYHLALSDRASPAASDRGSEVERAPGAFCFGHSSYFAQAEFTVIQSSFKNLS